MTIYREFTTATICGEEVKYLPPALVQMAPVLQWLTQGLGPTFLTKDQLDSMTSMQVFEECITYITELNSANVPEDDRNALWGAALVTSQASIDYLFPVIRTCFPEVKLETVTDEALNEMLSQFFKDYFASLQVKN
jgi:hypothetical protein